MIKQSPLIILDFGSQYTQLIGRRLREMGVYCEIHAYDVSETDILPLNPCGIILSGGPATVIEVENPRIPDWVFTATVPILGICYGMQAMAIQLGGDVSSCTVREFGHAGVTLLASNDLFDFPSFDVWMSHGDQVTRLPEGFEAIAATRNTPIAAMADVLRRWYGVQFHPEVTHTQKGAEILKRFVVDICHAPTDWTPQNIVGQAIEDIREQVGSDQVILGLSGGVDSSVVAALLHRAIGEQLICVFVDTGLLRLNEVEDVAKTFQERFGISLIVVDAQTDFLTALSGISCPEEKRKIIGQLFVKFFDEEAARFQNVAWLAQGTIYSDVIESGVVPTAGASHVIKSHHNVGGLPKDMNLRLLEPLRFLFKDEVRQVGLALGLPKELVFRHPFPGVGLGIRILGEVKKEYADILRLADAIFLEELRVAGLYERVSQAFAVFLPVKSVGVMGDGRRYDYVICLRAIETVDFMTAHWSHLPWDFLSQVSTRIINEVHGVSRVTYDISGKPPATIEWE